MVVLKAVFRTGQVVRHDGTAEDYSATLTWLI